MSYKFSENSRKLLNQCHRDIIIVCNHLIELIDFKVLDSTIRTYQQQEQWVKEGKSKTLNSKHLLKPSQAIDIAPCPLDWKDFYRFTYLAGMFLGCADILRRLGIIKSKFRWGGDWNRNNIFTDENFRDVVHLEIDT